MVLSPKSQIRLLCLAYIYQLVAYGDTGQQEDWSKITSQLEALKKSQDMSESAVIAVDLISSILSLKSGQGYIFIVDDFELLEAGAGKDNPEDKTLLRGLLDVLGFPQKAPDPATPGQRRLITTSKGRPLEMADRVRTRDPNIFDLDVDGLVMQGRYNLGDEIQASYKRFLKGQSLP
ncbi:MAG: hypothetical protein Q9160_008012 [Pyrenula sp. 1 TL-2023]